MDWFTAAASRDLMQRAEKSHPKVAFLVRVGRQWNCSSSVEPVSAVTDELPPWITVVMSSK